MALIYVRRRIPVSKGTNSENFKLTVYLRVSKFLLKSYLRVYLTIRWQIIYQQAALIMLVYIKSYK